jgi:Leucine-rich repeat (LRR) protein
VAPAVVLRPEVDPSGMLVVHHGAQLAQADLAHAEALDLALSPNDQVGHFGELDATTTCNDVDLVALAERAPKLTHLRISGCPSAIHAGLSAFGPRLRELTLADIELDGVTIGNLAALTGLESLTLVRVTLGHDSLKPLHALSLRKIELRDLDRDSDISTMLDLWPRSLQEVTLEGSWAAHNAMLTLARAEALEVLELRGTRIANFSLHQIKGLDHLRVVVLDGDKFNDKTPLYFRELPVERFVCNCSRLGDTGLRHLRHSTGIRELELRETEVTGVGLEEISKLEALETLVLLDRDLGPEGFSALAVLPKLHTLELSGPVEDPSFEKLGLLAHLQTLRLDCPSLDDSAAAELAKLPQLRVLDLSGSKLSDVGLAQLGGLLQLQELYLDGTRVTRAGLEVIAKLPQLRVLGLDRTDVVDAGVAALTGHPALEELRLDGTLVTDASVDVLLSMPALRRVSLARTVVSQAAVARLKGHPKLDAINIDDIRG